MSTFMGLFWSKGTRWKERGYKENSNEFAKLFTVVATTIKYWNKEILCLIPSFQI